VLCQPRPKPIACVSKRRQAAAAAVQLPVPKKTAKK
jgi:hypothetical protein